jgi:hypothetical protein
VRTYTTPPRIQILLRLSRLELFLCTGRRTKAECRKALEYPNERQFLRDFSDLECLGSGVVRTGEPGKQATYYCPRARAIFRHE